MKTVVIHGGIKQFKYILRTEEDVMEYHKISAHQHGRNALDFSSEPNRVRDIMKDLAEMRGDSMFMTAVKMTNDKTLAMLKQVNKGKVIVVNMAGGWCFWDDKDMVEITMEDFLDSVTDVKHIVPKQSSGYVYPDLPKSPQEKDIIRIYKTGKDLIDNKSDHYLQWDNGTWCEVCVHCKTQHEEDTHNKQMNRKAQLAKAFD